MLKNYFRIAWRNISRHKIHTAINVTGLAMGICACIVIYLITDYEFSFDRDHPDGDRICRIVGEAKMPDGHTMFLNSLLSDMGGIETQVPGFEAKAAFYDYLAGVSVPDGNNPPKRFDNRIAGSYAATTIITNPHYFEVFRYQWLAGDAAVLNEPFRVVLSKKRAEKYFGDLPAAKVIGRTVVYDDSLQVTVAGVVNDWAGNTDFGYTDFISIGTATHSFLRSRIATEDWNSLRPHSSMVFVKLEKGTKVETVNERMNTYIQEHPFINGKGPKVSLWLQPLTDIHFSKAFHRNDDGDDFRKPYLPTLYILMGVALFILVIAAVNFINLSTAQSIQRAREVGVRKVLGSRRSHIIFQFLIETFELTFFAVTVSVLLVKPVLHAFSDFIPEGLAFHPFRTNVLLFLGGITVVTTLLAGFYPARLLSSYLPALSLKGAALHKGTERVGLRKALIVFQFTISLIFIVAAMIIGKQMNFMKNADKGFNTDAIITINKWGDKQGKLQVFASNIQQLKGIDKVQLQANAPMGFAKMTMGFTYKDEREVSLEAVGEAGDEGYIPFYQMKLIAGRNLLHNDSLTEFVVNETLTKTLGFKRPEDALGKRLYWKGPAGERSYPIVGIVADFYQGSFHDAIAAAVIGNFWWLKRSVAIKLTASEKNSAEVKALLAGLEKEWKKVFPHSDFQYSFLNESIGFLYGQEEKTAWLINVAMGITIFISCMGLFGLGMFTAQRRTKEIGIRKVLGASVADITVLLNKDFVILLLVAFVISTPVSWWLMHHWLEDFAYRTTLSWWVFLAAGLLTVLMALLTVSFQAFKAAMANPVDSLRTE